MQTNTNIAAIGLGRSAQAPSGLTSPQATGDRVEDAKALKKAFSQFVGEAFYGAMLKSMRKTVGKPAFFHGGQAEEMFRERLDAQISQDLAGSPSNDLAESLFRSQFPHEAELLEQQATQPVNDTPAPSGLALLDGLKRR